MIRFIRVFPLALLLAAAAWTARAQQNPNTYDPIPNPQGSNIGGPGTALYADSASYPGYPNPQLYRLWKGLAGRYELQEDAKKLNLTLRPVSASPYVLLVEARTETGGKEWIERGYLELEEARPSNTSPKTRVALLYRPESRNNYSCLFYATPAPKGMDFQSDAVDCSFAIGGKLPKLHFDFRGDTIAATSEPSGEVTLLHRVNAK